MIVFLSGFLITLVFTGIIYTLFWMGADIKLRMQSRILKSQNKNIIYVGEILDEYYTTDSLELELSYPIWEICNNMRDSPLNWKIDDGRAVNDKESYVIWHYGKNNEFIGKISSITFNDAKKEGHELSSIENKFIMAQLKVLTEFYNNIDNIIDSNKSDNLDQLNKGGMLTEPNLTIYKIINELENL